MVILVVEDFGVRSVRLRGPDEQRIGTPDMVGLPAILRGDGSGRGRLGNQAFVPVEEEGGVLVGGLGNPSTERVVLIRRDRVPVLVLHFNEAVSRVIDELLVIGRLAARALLLYEGAVLVIAVGDCGAIGGEAREQLVIAVVLPVPCPAVVGEPVAELVVGPGFVGEPARVADRGQAVEVVIGVVVVAVFGGFPGDVRLGVVTVGVVEQRALAGAVELDPGRAQQGVVVAALGAAAGEGDLLRGVPLPFGDTQLSGGQADAGELLVAVVAVVGLQSARRGLAGFLAGRGPGGGEGVGVAADRDALFGLPLQDIERVAGAVGDRTGGAVLVGVPGQAADGVVGVGDGSAGRAAAGREVLLFRPAAGGVVGILKPVALGVLILGEVADFVVLVGLGLAERSGFAGTAVVPVIGVAGGVAIGVGDGDQVVALVVGVAGDAVQRVGDLRQAIQAVVGERGDFAVAVGDLRQVALGVVGLFRAVGNGVAEEILDLGVAVTGVVAQLPGEGRELDAGGER